jgi:hypothetical protein
MAVHALQTRGVVALQPPLSYVPAAQAPAHGVHLRSSVAVHAAVWYSPFGQAPEHLVQTVSALLEQAVCRNSPAPHVVQVAQTVSVVFVQAVLANLPAAHVAHALHALPSPTKPVLHAQTAVPLVSSHVASAAQPALAQAGVATHLPPSQLRPVPQSVAAEHACPALHLPQVAPPQSTSVSAAFLTPSVQVGSAEAVGSDEHPTAVAIATVADATRAQTRKDKRKRIVEPPRAGAQPTGCA